MAVFEKVERCLSTTSPMARFGGVRLRGLDNRRVSMYTCRLVELFGTGDNALVPVLKMKIG